METESENSSSGDESVFWLDSEVIQVTDSDMEEREVNFRKMKSSVHSEEDDFVPELHRNVHPRERPDWEEALSAMARGADVPDIPGESLKTCGSAASMKVKHVKKSTNPGLMGCDNIHRLPFTKGHFPKMAECAHFHYENVEFGSIQLSLSEEQNEVMKNGCESKELVYLVQIACQGKSWIVKRSYEDFRVLDKHLHLCIYDRRFSQLSELPRSDTLKDSSELVTQMLVAYLSRLSAIAGNKINCGPALTWMEIDNKGNHLLVHEESSINTPAVGAAHVIKRYTARAPDELSLEVGDIVSVIDMPPKVLSTWWRGKHGFQVGLFPGHCVELINQKVPQSVTNSVPKPVSKKHGKLITFLRTFMKSRPTKQKLKQRGILKERVFGCDLGEHLLNSGFEVPQVLQSCTAFIERYGIVDGIYRLSGVASNIQRLRHEFDSEHIPDLTKEPYVQDIHSVGSLCKLYFRELPNPLLTYQLYEKFSDAVSAATDEERLIKIHDVIQQLPPPHYRTLEFLMRHLSLLADYCSITNMHAKNLAIVWAPNLLRSKQIESACFSGTAAFMEVRIQSVVVEFILNHVDVLFSCKISAVIQDGAASLSRPKSLLVSSPSTKLLTLEEAQARTQAQVNSPTVPDNKYIEVGEGPAALQGKFHTIIEFPLERKRPPNKMKKSPVGSWRSFFNLGKSSSVSKRKLQRNESEPSEMKAMALKGSRAEGTLRSAKSEESLTSLHAVDGDSKLFRPRRPRSSSDALSASFNGEMLGNRCNSYDNLPHDNESEEEEGLLHIPALMSPHLAEDVDLSPPDIGVASLDFDPMSFQCSPPKAESECLESTASLLDSMGFPKDKTSTSKNETEAGSQSQTPGSTNSSEPVSPLQEKLSPFFTLDLSPTEDKVSKPSSFTEKVVYAFSPKIGRKLSKSPSINISEPISVTVPSRVSEVIGTVPSSTSQNTSSPTWNKGFGEGDIVSRSPTQVVIIRTNERDSREVCQSEVQSQDQVTAEAVGLPGKVEQSISSSQSKAVPSGQAQTGAVAHDSPQDLVPVSSVSLIPPPPPPKNAARMLALALAESAQQASTQSLKRPGNSHAGCPNYGDTTVVTPEDKQPSSYISFPLEKPCFHSSMSSEQLHLQNASSGNYDQPKLGVVVAEDHSNSIPIESVEQPYHSTGSPVNQAHMTCFPGESEKAEIAMATLVDSDKVDSHVVLHENPGKTNIRTVSFGNQDEPHIHFSSGEQLLSSLDTSVDKSQLSSEPEEKVTSPYGLPVDKIHPSPGSPVDKAAAAPTVYMTPTPASSEISTRETSWDMVGQPLSSADLVSTLQRTHRANCLPLSHPSQRPAEQQLVVAQVPAATSAGLNNSHKVRGVASAPEKPPEPRVAESSSVFSCDGNTTTRCATYASTIPPGLPEKVWEGARAPPLHLRSESVPTHTSQGFALPVPPTRTMDSKIATAIHSGNADGVTTSSYHSFITASSASMDDSLPPPPPVPQPKHASQKPPFPSYMRPDIVTDSVGTENCLHLGLASTCQFRPQSVPPHHHKPEQHQVYGSRSETPSCMGPRYNTYMPPGKNSSGYHSKPCSRVEYVSSVSPSLRSACYPEDIPPYPTIRRVQSLHAPPSSMIRSVPISRTEVPPDDEPSYCPRPLYQYKPYQSSQARSDYHVTQLQPYFENGRVHYRYSPYSSSSGPYYASDGTFYDMDTYGTVQLRPLHRVPNRDFNVYNPRLQGKTFYRYPGVPPRPPGNIVGYLSGNEHNLINMTSSVDGKHVYASWDLEDMEKYRMQSIRRESRARQKVKGPVMSQYDNMTPAVQDDMGGIYVIHLRSKSDPGKTGLLSVAEGKEGRYPTKAVTPEGDDRFYKKHPEPELDRAHYHGGYGNGQSEKPSLPLKQSSLRNRKIHDMSANPSEHRAHQEVSHRQLCESKNGPPYPSGAGQLDYGNKGIPDTSEPVSYHPAGGKYSTLGQDTLRLNHKEVRPSEELERTRIRQPPGPEKLSRDCYKEDEHPAPSIPPPKPERSHSLKLHHTQSMERDPNLLYQYQMHGKRQSNMTVLSQYENLDDYHPMPQHQRGGFGGAGGAGGGGGMGTFIPPGFPHPQNRTYATALGQGAFLSTELSLQNPETQIHAE
ncbi:rho GTPase-activating protein 32 isoform X2 [Monodelphis domestica]|uniref:rho GTPase-activating protein 32 isoform X2 n=1 Tax=Monodelphis domestica TaxID=13616 RepID=UPI0024E1F79A|nr:rho GTPase-activating protein 32 isoform X2 [Monodelphis domestica]